MIAKVTWLTVTVGLLVGSSAVAQNQSSPQGQGPGIWQVAEKNENRATMYEEIEIMRQLLSRKLEKLYSGSVRQAWNLMPGHNFGLGSRLAWQELGATPLGLNNMNVLPLQNGEFLNLLQNGALGYSGSVTIAQPRSLDIEGSYLKGQGIVYTMTLPACLDKADTEPAKPPRKRLTDWERIRKHLHGEAEPEAGEQASSPSKEPNLMEILLNVLFENGHRFTQLGENEKLTVVVTFRPDDPKDPQGTDATNAAPSAGSVPFANAPTPGGQAPGAAEVGGIPGSPQKPPSSARDYLLLGDLHLKQGEVNAAQGAYRRALEQASSESRERNTLGLMRELHQKLAQAYLAANDLENARKEFDELDKLHKRGAAKRDSSDRSVEGKLPAKLFISASKKLLDQAGAGKVSLEDFKKSATVEHLDFTKPKAGSPTTRN